jgi:hypothetical protein
MENLFDIAEYIPYGAENAIARHELLKIAQYFLGDISDREMRRILETSRQNGNIIINFQNGKGYFRPETREEVEQYIRQEEARAKKIQFNLKSARKALRKMEGQLTIDDI